MTIRFYLHLFGESLGFLCFVGLIACYFRWQTAVRREFVVAFALVMLGIITREFAVWQYDAITWADGSTPLYIVTVSRILFLSGATVYIWGASRFRKNGWFITMSVVIFAFFFALFIV